MTVRVMRDMTSSILRTFSPDTIPTVVPKRYGKLSLHFLGVFTVLTTLSLLYGVGWDDTQTARSWSPFTQRPDDGNPSAVNLTSSPDYPPDYAEWHEIEEALPQHNQNLSFPEGKEGRYVYFSEHVKSKPLLVLVSVPPLGIPGG